MGQRWWRTERAVSVCVWDEPSKSPQRQQTRMSQMGTAQLTTRWQRIQVPLRDLGFPPKQSQKTKSMHQKKEREERHGVEGITNGEDKIVALGGSVETEAP